MQRARLRVFSCLEPASVKGDECEKRARTRILAAGLFSRNQAPWPQAGRDRFSMRRATHSQVAQSRKLWGIYDWHL